MNFGYVFPWDIVGDPAAPERLAATGVDAIALAASYHSTRAATPFHPAHRVLEVPHSALYLPVRRDAYGPLTPKSPSWTPPDAYLQARDALKSTGLPVHAWTVLTHNTSLGRAHPALTVRNAFGDPYPHALCPSHPDVLDYCANLVSEIIDLGEPDGIILEACGPMGIAHQSVHDKTAGADWTPTQSALLSLCFCTACTPKYPDTLQAQVRAAIDTSPPSMEAALGDLTPQLSALRTTLTTTLHTRVIKAAHNHPIRLHASADPWSTGSFSPFPTSNHRTTTSTPNQQPEHRTTTSAPDQQPERRTTTSAPDQQLERRTTTSVPDQQLPGSALFAPRRQITDSDQALTGVVAPCWGTDEEASANLTDLAGSCRKLGAYTTILPPKAPDPEQLARTFTTLTQAGANELHLYHLGLASPPRLSALTSALHLLKPQPAR
ncbi:hypothetical protein Aple_058630 [Acrocarpospora pleiomorpha]|uniref:Alanine-rich protein n=1 Tax=Acrocarpospora pleiomorpha TaxID=90975 RepID=A0A5M3XP09_9ACTN|nr:hypothetical protein [Acrocarpospora pleiomorpha]GES22964.1 hypothetical protein Aple_058630 [Acrocarpospora pleiomorpha]